VPWNYVHESSSTRSGPTQPGHPSVHAVQLHALAMELMKRPGSASGLGAEKLSPSQAANVGTSPGGGSGGELSDSQLRRLLLRKLRQQSAVDLVR